MEELADTGRTVNFRSFIVVTRDFLQTGDEQHHVITDDRPDTDHTNGNPGDFRVGDPGGVGVENVVQQTKLLVVEPFPDHSNSCRGTNHRQEEDGAESGCTLKFFVKEYSKNQGDHNAEGNFDECVFDRIPQRGPGF